VAIGYNCFYVRPLGVGTEKRGGPPWATKMTRQRGQLCWSVPQLGNGGVNSRDQGYEEKSVN